MPLKQKYTIWSWWACLVSLVFVFIMDVSFDDKINLNYYLSTLGWLICMTFIVFNNKLWQIKMNQFNSTQPSQNPMKSLVHVQFFLLVYLILVTIYLYIAKLKRPIRLLDTGWFEWFARLSKMSFRLFAIGLVCGAINAFVDLLLGY